MHFASNLRADSAVSEWLGTSDSTPPVSVWMVVDAALVDTKRLKQIAGSLRWNMSNALEGSALERFGAQGPQLIEMNGDASAVTAGLKRLIDIDKRAPAFSVIESPVPLKELQSLCGYLALAQVDGDLKVHCRFADTRVLPHLLNALSAPQLARVSMAITRWSWVDHLGQNRQWATPARALTTGLADASPHLELNMAQFNALLDASEPDTMFSLLTENTPELVPADARGDFRDALAAILATANGLMLTSPNDRWQFVVLSLSCGVKFHEHPELQPMWLTIKQGTSTLVDEMKLWGDALWAELERK
jgi:Domain of unknown function (DUF4123)